MTSITKRPAIASLAELPEVCARHWPNEEALICSDGRLTYAELAAQAQRVARRLWASNVGPGTRVALVGRDSCRSVCTLFGAARVKAVHVAINWRLAAQEIAYILRDAEPEVVFFDPCFAAVVIAGVEHLPQAPMLVCLADEELPGAQGWPTWLEGPTEEPRGQEFGSNDAVVQLYTSGTTGHPKGVLLANRTFFAIADAMKECGDEWMGLSSEDTTLLFVPCFHIGGLWWLVRVLSQGSRNIVLETFEPHVVLRSIAEFRVTRTEMVPAMMQVLLAEPECAETDFSSLRSVLYGGAPIAPALLERARRVFNCDFFQIYGLTETGNMAACLRAADHNDSANALAAGRSLPGVDIEVVDERGRPVPDGAVGEIRIKSPAQMLGYHGNETATAATVVDGWIMTGDGGFRRLDGMLFVCARMKDMLICAGENVYPGEIERVMSSHPAVTDVAVIGIPHELWGECAAAFVIRKRDIDVSERELLRFTSQHLADFKVPRSVEFVDDLPRTASGKVQKGVLRERYWAGSERQVN